MKYKFGKTIVIALGGSIIYPHTKRASALRAQKNNNARYGVGVNSEAIDIQFLKSFRTFILKRLRNGSRFVIVAGGGRIARVYQEAAGKISKITDDDKDWIGIHATRLNAHLLRTMFRGVADPVVIDSRYKIKKLRHPVTIASGWRPGWSTDYIAVALAQGFGVPEAIVAGRPAFVYDKDNQKHNGAKPFHNLSWQEYRRLIPKKWKPGIHAPVDPVAAKLAERKKIKAIIVSGKDLKNFSNLLSGKDFRGTIVE